MSGAAGRFGRWWLEQLVSIGHRRGEQQPDGVVLALATSDGPVRVLRRRGARSEALGEVALGPQGRAALSRMIGRRRGPVSLRLRQALLHRDIVLPLAAERDLRRVLAYELERVTPFTAAEVHWDYRVRKRDVARGQLVVELVITPRAVLDPVLQALAGLGVAPARVEPDEPGGALRLSSPGAGRQLRLVRVLATVCVVLALVAAVLPIIRQSLALAALETRMDALRPRVERAQAIRRRLGGEGQADQVIAAETARVGNALDILATVTGLLPDDTYLVSLALRARELTLEGRSRQAAGLIGTLSADPAMQAVHFIAPVTRSGSGEDVFTLQARAGQARAGG